MPSASDCTTTAGTPRVSRMKHFRHSPVSSIAKQSCMKDSNSYLRDRDAKHLQGPPLSRTKRVKERRKIELMVRGKKVPIALDGIRTCISGIRAHSASDCTTTAGTPRVSRMKHFRHSPVSSIAKQSCMKDSNSYLRDRDAKHLQGPPLSRTKRVKERRKIELTVRGKKVPIALDGIRTCISGIRAHSASDCTTTAGTPRVSRMKHFRHSPVSSIAKQSCMKDSNSYLRDRDAKHLQGPPLSRTKRVKERRKIELMVRGKKVPIALDGIRTCISGIRAHSASDCTTTAGTPRVSRMKHFRHSPVSSIAKQSCMKDSNSYLRDRDAKHLQGPPLSRTKRVKERRKIELMVRGKKCPLPSTGFEPVSLGYAPIVWCNRKHYGRVSQRYRFESRRGQWALFSLIPSALSFVFL